MKRERLTYLLDRYHEEKLTPSEHQELDNWYMAFDAKPDDLHLRYFSRHSGRVAKRIYQRVLEQISPTASRRFIWPYAAVVALLLLASFTGYSYRAALLDQVILLTNRTVTVPPGKMRTVDLPDGSRVWLRAGSQMTYNRFFLGRHREVDLHGEAFFEVEKDPDKPFVVSSERYAVKVLGTSFNVKALMDFQVYEVAVRTGKVQVSDSGNIVADLEAHEAIAFREGRKHTPDRSSIGNRLSWRNGELVFSNNSMAEIAWYLENFFKVNISFSMEDFRHCRFSGDFSGLKLSQVLEILQEVHPFEVRYEGEDHLLLTSSSHCVK